MYIRPSELLSFFYGQTSSIEGHSATCGKEDHGRRGERGDISTIMKNNPVSMLIFYYYIFYT